jgi:hypothetical protein
MLDFLCLGESVGISLLKLFKFGARRIIVRVSYMGQAHRRTINRAHMSVLLVRETDLTRKLLIFQERD